MAVQQIPEPQLRLALFCAALAGLIDVVAFLALGGFFASFMSGNSTRLAIGIGGNLSDALLAASLIASFVVGVAGAILIGRRAGPMRSARVIGLTAALILLCALVAKPYQATQMLLLAAAMGALNGLFDRGDAAPVGLTYMTGTLVRIGTALGRWVGGEGPARDALRPALLWASFLGGGMIGVGLYWRIGLDSLWFAGAFAAALALGLGWQVRRAQRRAAMSAAEDQAVAGL